MEIPSKWTCRIQQIRTSEVPWNRARLAKPLVLDSGDDTSGLSVVQSSYKRWLSNETPMALIHISGKTSHGSMCYHMGSTHGKLPNKFHISMVFFHRFPWKTNHFYMISPWFPWLRKDDGGPWGCVNMAKLNSGGTMKPPWNPTICHLFTIENGDGMFFFIPFNAMKI